MVSYFCCDIIFWQWWWKTIDSRVNSVVQILELERELLLQITSINSAGGSEAQSKPTCVARCPSGLWHRNLRFGVGIRRILRATVMRETLASDFLNQVVESLLVSVPSRSSNSTSANSLSWEKRKRTLIGHLQYSGHHVSHFTYIPFFCKGGGRDWSSELTSPGHRAIVNGRAIIYLIDSQSTE